MSETVKMARGGVAKDKENQKQRKERERKSKRVSKRRIKEEGK